jgi:ABC-2 type transport system permease protein
MNALLAVELRRFRSRRSAVVIAGAAILALILGASLTFALSNRNIAGATEKARARATAEYQDCVRNVKGADGSMFGESGKCEMPDLSTVTADPRFKLVKLPEVLSNVSGFLIIVGLVLGASFVGAEWHHRTMALTLTWEPRRVRVALAKIVAAAASVMVGALILQILLSSALLPAAFFRGTTEGISSSWVGHTISVGIRSAAAAGIATSLGAALALIARNTAFAIGIWFVWFAVLEGIVRQAKPGWERWLIGDNTAGFIAGGADAPRTGWGSGILLGVYVAVAAWLAVSSFARRDVA